MVLVEPLPLATVRRALALPGFDGQAAQLQMAPAPRPFERDPARSGLPRVAAVLVLLYPLEDGTLAFPLMKRNEYPGVHSGQISLPGGSAEAGETPEQTALRETCEEFGVCDGVELLGLLTPLYVPPSDFEIHPVVGWSVARPVFQPDPREVAALLEIPLVHLLDDARKLTGNWELGSGIETPIRYYDLGESVVWGATAIILSEFEQRLRAALTLPVQD